MERARQNSGHSAERDFAADQAFRAPFIPSRWERELRKESLMPRFIKLSFLSLLLIAFSSPLLAQSTTSLRGTITDAKAAVLPDATVTLTDPKTGFSRT